jgi:hypothetical protein
LLFDAVDVGGVALCAEQVADAVAGLVRTSHF